MADEMKGLQPEKGEGIPAEKMAESSKARTEKAAEKSIARTAEAESGWDDGESYIDTTYLTQERKADPAARGYACLLLSLILSGFVAGFGGLYGYMVMNGKMTAFEGMGELLPQTGVLIWIGCAGLGLLLNLIAVGTKMWITSFMAVLFYAAAAAVTFVLLHLEPFYYYLALTLPQAVLCLIAALRKGSGKKI